MPRSPSPRPPRRPRFVPAAALALLVASLAPLAATAAEIFGTVKLPPPRKPTVVNQRYEVLTHGGTVATDPPLAVVYLEGEFAAPATPPVAEIRQQELRFLPTLLPVRRGTRVEFPNDDAVYHNIFSYSAPKRFDLGRYRADEKPVPAQVFDTPGLVTLRCDIHEHMRALILVVATPHFQVTAPDGTYRLRGLPAGKYTLKAWLDSRTTLERPVVLEAATELRADFP